MSLQSSPARLEPAPEAPPRRGPRSRAAGQFRTFWARKAVADAEKGGLAGEQPFDRLIHCWISSQNEREELRYAQWLWEHRPET